MCRGFTLFEIMVVVGIIGIACAIGVPSIVRTMKKEGIRKAVSDMVEACSEARTQAILTGDFVTLVIHPQDGTISGGKFSATLPETVRIYLLGVNLIELQDAVEAIVRFFPIGTTDVFAILLRSDDNEVRQISLDVITGLADVKVVR